MTFTRSAAKRLKRLSTSDSRTLYYSTALVSTSSALLLWHNSTILAADGPPLVQGQVAAPKDKQAVSVMDVMQSRGMVAWGELSSILSFKRELILCVSYRR